MNHIYFHKWAMAASHLYRLSRTTQLFSLRVQKLQIVYIRNLEILMPSFILKTHPSLPYFLNLPLYQLQTKFRKLILHLDNDFVSPVVDDCEIRFSKVIFGASRVIIIIFIAIDNFQLLVHKNLLDCQSLESLVACCSLDSLEKKNETMEYEIRLSVLLF